jgi:3-oxoacyl-[acyl-carrier-protein] synthase II
MGSAGLGSLISYTFKMCGPPGGNTDGSAVLSGFARIKSGAADVMVCGGVEDVTHPYGFKVMEGYGATRGASGDPGAASRPLDSAADGFVPSDGASALVLEEYEHAVARGAQIYCEVLGIGVTSDTEVSVGGVKSAATSALAMAGVETTAVDAVIAHGSSIPTTDRTELEALTSLFDTASLTLVPFKSTTGYMGAASSIAESAFASLMISRSIVPPATNINAPLTPSLKISTEIQQKVLNVVLQNTIGFNGVCSSLVFGKLS